MDTTCGEQYWIGAIDAQQDGTFQWLDGQQFAYSHWGTSKAADHYLEYIFIFQTNPTRPSIMYQCRK